MVTCATCWLGESLDDRDDIFSAWDALYYESIPYGRKGIGVMALSGIDLALWDLLAKSEGVPVPRGHRAADKGDDSAPMRQAVTRSGTARWASPPTSSRIAGLGTLPSSMPRSSRLSRAREIMGPDARLMIDTYMTWDSETTVRKWVRLLAPYDIFWFEDVLTPDDLDGQAALRPLVKPTLIAGGEHEFTHIGFDAVARAGAMDLWQPDITWCGGITAGLRILDIAREHEIPVAPHRGGEVWGIHLIASSDCIDLAEVLPGMRGAPKDDLWIGEPFPERGLHGAV